MRRLPVILAALATGAVVVACSSTTAPPTETSGSSTTGSPGSSTPAESSGSSAPSTPATSSESATSSSKKASAPLPDAAAILEEAHTATAELRTVRMTLAVAGGIDLPIKSMRADVTGQPDAAGRGTTTVALGDGGIELKFVVLDGRFLAALPSGEWVDYGPADGVYDPTAVLRPDSGLANLLANFVDPQVESRETVTEQHVVRVDGDIAADAVNGIVPQLKATKRTRCSVWIQETGQHRVVQLKLAPGDDDSVEIGFSNWNAAVRVDKPTR